MSVGDGRACTVPRGCPLPVGGGRWCIVPGGVHSQWEVGGGVQYPGASTASGGECLANTGS